MSYILVTGGTGFIGGNFVLDWLADPSTDGIVNVDRLTYAGNRKTLAVVEQDSRHAFSQADICDYAAFDRLFAQYRPRVVVHLAAESHVDRSTHGPGEFIQTNIVGTFTLPETARAYWSGLDGEAKAAFRFLHVLTDGVFGSLGPTDPQFSEITPYTPNSPCSVSRVASDHLMRVYRHTYGLPVLTTSCSNGYGPYHFPEKLIPLMITDALSGRLLPVYGDGQNVRDWLYVGDRCAAIREALACGRLGEMYNVGGWNEKTSPNVVYILCDLLDEPKPKTTGSYRDQVALMKDRPGHNRCYVINTRGLERELGWKPVETFETDLQKTVQWHLSNQAWVQDVVSGEYRNWVAKQYAT